MGAPELVWGLIGTSGYAERACLPSFAATPSASLRAVVGSEPDRAAAFALRNGVPVAHDDIKSLVDDPEIGAVWIASSSFLHFEHAVAAIDAGKHVLLEKPIALSAEQGWQLVRLAESAGVKVATGYQARYVPAHQRMRDLIAEEAIGRVVAARTLYGMRRVGPPRTWRGDQSLARWGVLADIGTHHIDLLRMLLGDIVVASGDTEHQNGFETEDLAVATIRFSTGALASMVVTGNWFRPTTVVEVVGTEGALVATDTSPDGQGHAEWITLDGTVHDITGETPLSQQAQLETVTAAFLGADVPYATGVDGARNLDVLEMISP
jgi:1,5-anhydro-D-fructose reductase (1,5-anhydro-D-mannitol-forming)